MLRSWVLVTGATGFIGQHLINDLLTQGFAVIGLTRQVSKQSEHEHLLWVQDFNQIQQKEIDYVINLAGENIGASRWTNKRKEQLIQSRVGTTRDLFHWLIKNQIQPKRIISGSAVGFYGIDETEQWQMSCTEDSASQAIFMSELCQKWEAEALAYPQFDVRIIRLGVVLAKDGGILPQMLKPIQLNLVGKIGSGQQPFAWIHIRDVLAVFKFLFETENTTKIFNVVAPEQTSQQQFVASSKAILKKHPFLPLPACVLKLGLGEQSQLVLNGQYVRPQALSDAGFQFQFPDIDTALSDILVKS
ncbi:MAG: TIGR01777 family oxidoreductase [Candidatus Acinetobacter avistercoris]|uniref:TIGR01777 family oxidoreductase n=1 Tax=Acinetobacter sp. KS-LM10 TaxID=3120518 RepID=UPI001F9E084C|nr:TIGR01777 family oxidoreductase [Candidatus Acinetobacter avistercoris]